MNIHLFTQLNDLPSYSHASWLSIAESEAKKKKKSCKARVLLYTQLQGKTLNDKMLQKRRKKIPLKSQCHKNRDKF